MIKSILTLLIILFCAISWSEKITGQSKSFTIENQSKSTDTAFFEIPDTGIYKGLLIEFDEHAEFPGGEKALVNYLITNIIYPPTAIKDSITGRVSLIFVINVDGTTSDIKVMRSVRSDCDNECIRVIKEMPKWKPCTTVLRAKQGLYNSIVREWYTLHFEFTLDNDHNKRGIIIRPRNQTEKHKT